MRLIGRTELVQRNSNHAIVSTAQAHLAVGDRLILAVQQFFRLA
jgi:uncharacterized protein (DUF2345 family)